MIHCNRGFLSRGRTANRSIIAEVTGRGVPLSGLSPAEPASQAPGRISGSKNRLCRTISKNTPGWLRSSRAGPVTAEGNPPHCTTNLKILYAVHEFLTRFPVTCSAQASRRGDQFLQPSGPRRQDRRDLLPAACCNLIPMRFGDFLDQSVGAQERQQTAHLPRLSPVHCRILRPLAVEAMPHVAVAEARDQMTPAPANSNNRASTSPNGLSGR